MVKIFRELDTKSYIIFITQDGFVKKCLISNFKNGVDLNYVERFLGGINSKIIYYKLINEDIILDLEIIEETFADYNSITFNTIEIEITAIEEKITQKIKILCNISQINDKFSEN